MPQGRGKRIKRSPQKSSRPNPPSPTQFSSRQAARNPSLKKQKPSVQKSALNRAIVVQTLELSIKLGVNGILGVAAIIGLIKLVPYTFHRHTGLQQLQAEAIAVEGRVDVLQQDFHRYFDPNEAEAIARQETIRIGPNQKRIYLQSEPASNVNP